jgi:hypothetical protein
MSAASVRMFRETHREVRLRPLLSGREPQQDVRPLSLTQPAQKIINIKDAISQVAHEQSTAIPRHTPPLP